MFGLLIALLTLATIAWNVARRKAERAERDAAWGAVAEELGLRHTPETWTSGPGISGELYGLPVSASIVSRDDRNERSAQYTRCTLGLPRALEGVHLSAESARGVFNKLLRGEDLQTGDAAFDELVYVRGPALQLRAAFGAEARQQVAQLVASGGGVDGGEIWLEDEGALASKERLRRMLEQVAGVGLALRSTGREVPAGLARNACEDPLASVRLENLRELCARYPQSRAAEQAQAAALGDPDPRVRLLGASGLRTAEAAQVLAELVTNPTADGPLRAEALAALAAGRPYAEAAASVAAGLEDGDPEVQRAALLAAGQARDASLFDKAVRLGPRSDDALAAALAWALGELGDPRGERPLLLLLEQRAAPVRAAAARALGKIGTVDAVEPLLPLTKGLIEAGEVKEAAREAVRGIQARLGDAAAGRLSLVPAGETAGALSLAAPEGAVSLAGPPDAADPAASAESAPAEAARKRTQE